MQAARRLFGRSVRVPLQQRSFVQGNLWRRGTQTATWAAPNARHYYTVGAAGLGLASAFLFGSFLSAEEKAVKEEASGDTDEPTVEAGLRVEGLKEISKEEVSKHKSAETGIWVTYKNGVYDITEFVASHPGGREKILLAAGASIEPFWALYAVHVTAHSILEAMRIGNLPEAEVSAPQAAQDGPYKEEPSRLALMRANSLTPFNGEPPLALLAEELITPNELFYVRNHLPVPVIDPEEYRLTVEVPGREPLQLSLADLAKLEQHTVATTIQCAGNRRDEMTSVKEVKGLRWGNAAISTARWSGVWLRDVLALAGLTAEEVAAAELKHVQFEGLDTDGISTWYGASIPVRKAISSEGDVMLALEMNGEPIPRDHGYPVRAIVPGVVGARNVKWLGKVIASAEESGNHWQQRDYKGFPPTISFDNVDWDSAPAIQDMPVQSSICSPLDGHHFDPEEEDLVLKGYAWSGGGRDIVRVDVSIDDGKNWLPTQLIKLEEQRDGEKAWAWTLWEATVDVPEELRGSKLSVVCKAVDSSYNVQPDSVDPLWNMRGVLNNSWHRIEVSTPVLAKE